MNTKPFAVTGFGVVHHIDQVGAAGLRHRAERLLQDRGQPARLVAGRGIGVHLGALARACSPPTSASAPPASRRPRATPRGASADARRHRSPASPTGSPCRHAAPADRSPHPARDWRRRRNSHPNRRIAAPRVSSLAGTGSRCTWFASASTSFTKATPASTVLRVPPIDWMSMLRMRSGQPLLLHQAADLVHLAAQAQHDDMREIGMPRIARQRAAQHAQRLALGHAAAGLVRQRHHAIDIGKLRQRIVAGERIAAEHIGDQPGDMRRAVHRWSGCRCSCASPRAHRGGGCPRTSPACWRSRSASHRRRRHSPWRSRPSRSSAHARAGRARSHARRSR